MSANADALIFSRPAKLIVTRPSDSMNNNNNISLTHHSTHRANSATPRNEKILNEWHLRELIGEGVHGKVFKAKSSVTGKIAAVKSLRRNPPKKQDKFRQLRRNNPQAMSRTPHTKLVDNMSTLEAKILREVAIMRKCNHPNIVQLLDVINDRDRNHIYIVMDYCTDGEIKWRNTDDQPILTILQIRRILRDAILGLEYLHFQGIVHRDIKPANLLWTDNRTRVKIADFGVSHFSAAQRISRAKDSDPIDPALLDDCDLSKRAGTPAFLAPELLDEQWDFPTPPSASASNVASSPSSSSAVPRRQPVTEAIDIWALGVTMYCLLFGRTPFNADAGVVHGEFTLYRAICHDQYVVDDYMGLDQIPTGGADPPDDGSEGSIVIHLLNHLLQKDVSRRITLKEIKAYNWFTHDVSNPAMWRQKFDHDAEPIKPSESEAHSPLTAVRFKWNWASQLTRQVSSVFRSVRPSRGGSERRPRRSKEDSFGSTSAPSVAMGRHRRPQSSRSAPRHTSGSASESRATGAALRSSAQQNHRHHSQNALQVNGETTRSKSTDRLSASQKRSSSNLHSSPPKPRRGSDPNAPPFRGSRQPSSTNMDDRSRTGFHLNLSSVFRWSASKFSSSQGSSPLDPHSSSPSVQNMASPSDQMIRRSVEPLFYAADNGSVIASLTHDRRASSWGENGGDYVDVTSLNSDDADLDDHALIVGAGGISDDVTFVPGASHAYVAEPGPSTVIRQVKPGSHFANGKTVHSNPGESPFASSARACVHRTSNSPLTQVAYHQDDLDLHVSRPYSEDDAHSASSASSRLGGRPSSRSGGFYSSSSSSDDLGVNGRSHIFDLDDDSVEDPYESDSSEGGIEIQVRRGRTPDAFPQPS